MAVLIVKELIERYNIDGNEVHAAFLDMSKAYDCLNHYTLIEKLIKAGLPSGVISIIKAVYFNQKIFSTYADSSTESCRIGNGIRQGGILSGILFNFYIDSMIKLINSTNSGCILHHNKYAIVAYADDLVLLSPSKQGLQHLCNMVSTELLKLDLKLNPWKCKYLRFRKGVYRKLCFIYINNCKVDESEISRYILNV